MNIIDRIIVVFDAFVPKFGGRYALKSRVIADSLHESLVGRTASVDIVPQATGVAFAFYIQKARSTRNEFDVAERLMLVVAAGA